MTVDFVTQQFNQGKSCPNNLSIIKHFLKVR